jgi:hypothetical protein
VRLLEQGEVGCVSSLSIVVCCRCISAVQKLRAAPAHAFAALNHMLIEGFFIVSLATAEEREVTDPPFRAAAAARRLRQ